MPPVVDIANHASAQSDRWLFVALLVVVGFAAVFVWRWMVADRENTSKRLEDMTNRHIASQERLSDVVANNTAALTRVNEALTNCRGWQAMTHLRPEPNPTRRPSDFSSD